MTNDFVITIRYVFCCFLFCCIEFAILLCDQQVFYNSFNYTCVYFCYIYSRLWTRYYWSCFDHGDTICNLNRDDKHYDTPHLLHCTVAYSRLETETAPLSYCQTATRARRRLHSIYCSLIKLLAHQKSSIQ